MEKQIKIESINFSIGKRELTLTLEEARKLKEALDTLFGKEQVHHWHYDWWYKYNQRQTPNPLYPVTCCPDNTLGIVVK